MTRTLDPMNRAAQPPARLDHRPAVCGCGQDLDMATGTHCPRCGAQLGEAHFEPVGFWYAA